MPLGASRARPSRHLAGREGVAARSGKWRGGGDPQCFSSATAREFRSFHGLARGLGRRWGGGAGVGEQEASLATPRFHGSQPQVHHLGAGSRSWHAVHEPWLAGSRQRQVLSGNPGKLGVGLVAARHPGSPRGGSLPPDPRLDQCRLPPTPDVPHRVPSPGALRGVVTPVSQGASLPRTGAAHASGRGPPVSDRWRSLPHDCTRWPATVQPEDISRSTTPPRVGHGDHTGRGGAESDLFRRRPGIWTPRAAQWVVSKSS